MARSMGRADGRVRRGAPRRRKRLVDDGQCESIGHHFRQVARDRRGRADQAGRGAGRIPSVSSRTGLARLMPSAWDCTAWVSSVRMEPRLPDDPAVVGIAQRLRKTPGQVVLAWAARRGTACLTTSGDAQPHPEEPRAFDHARKCLARDREHHDDRPFNAVAETGVPGPIPRAKVD